MNTTTTTIRYTVRSVDGDLWDFRPHQRAEAKDLARTLHDAGLLDVCHIFENERADYKFMDGSKTSTTRKKSRTIELF
jgi:hypothetical protein